MIRRLVYLVGAWVGVVAVSAERWDGSALAGAGVFGLVNVRRKGAVRGEGENRIVWLDVELGVALVREWIRGMER